MDSQNPSIENEIPRVRPDEHKTAKRPAPEVDLQAMAVAWDDIEDAHAEGYGRKIAETFFETYAGKLPEGFDVEAAKTQFILENRVVMEAIVTGLIPTQIASALVTFSALRRYLPETLRELADEARLKAEAFAEYRRLVAEVTSRGL